MRRLRWMPGFLPICWSAGRTSRKPTQMAVANAQIGIARAAYYPSLNLFGTGGWQAADIAKLINVQSTFWAVGANVAESIFTGGSRRAQVQFAKAGYDANVAAYRDSVLNAFREVQDDVTGLTVLDQANQAQQQASIRHGAPWTLQQPLHRRPRELPGCRKCATKSFE